MIGHVVTGRRARGVLVGCVALVAAACSGGENLEDSFFTDTTTSPRQERVETGDAQRPTVSTPRIRLPDAADFWLPEPESTPVGTDGVVAAAGSSSVLDRLPDLTGQTISIIGPEAGPDADSFAAGLAPFEAATGAEIVYTDQQTTEPLVALVDAGTPPDVAVISQPGQLLDLASLGIVLPLPQLIVDLVRVDFDPFWGDLVTQRGRMYGVPNRASVKSLVWYDPDEFERNDYDVPESWEAMEALMTQMRDNGDTPWCVGIGSGSASGWVFTDWVEDAMLRLHGPEVYDAWVNHDIGFDDDRVLAAVEWVDDVWFGADNVLGGRDRVASASFRDAGLPLLDGECMMHRQASFYASIYTDAGARLGPDGDVDVFYLPTISDDFGQVVLGAGSYAAPITDREATYALLSYLASPEYADARSSSGIGGFISPNVLSDASLYPSELEQGIAEILQTASPFRFDASDLMPAAVGADEFWRSGISYVTGAIQAQNLVDRVEAAWPQ